MTFQIVFPVKEDTDNPVNQSKHKAITCSPREVRENECKRVTIGFWFTSDWMEKWREYIFKPIT